jgi:SAM-dependent methyltransferase
MPFTGERLTSDYGGQTKFEHLHRYLLAREFCRGVDVLDVASGEGYGAALLAQIARSVAGIEIASEAVAHATTSYARPNLRFLGGDARALPLQDEAFDVVVSFETIEHFAEQERFVAEVRRVLRPGGLFIVSTPDRDNYSPAEAPANPYHVRELTRDEFLVLLRGHFADVDILLQRPVLGSVMLPCKGGESTPLCFERRGTDHFEASGGLARAQYLIAFASGKPIGHSLPASVYIETARLGMLDPDQMQSRLEALTTECDGIRCDLAAARGEVQGLTFANEMAERACGSLREELVLARANADRHRSLEQEHAAAKAELAKANESLEQEHAAAKAELAAAKAELAAAKAELAKAKKRLAKMRASPLWRLAWPFRKLSKLRIRRQ